MVRGRRGAIVATAAAAALAAAASAASAATPPTVAGCEVFPEYAGKKAARSADDQTAWNQVVARSPKHPRSDRYLERIARLGGNQRIHPDFGGEGEYGIPFIEVPASEPPVDVGFGAYPEESDFGAGNGDGGPDDAPIPLDAPIEGGAAGDGDRHVIAVRSAHCDLWEMYRAFPGASSWTADSTALFELDSAGRHPETWTSADAAGLPILPGLVRYEEAAAGRIDHAIRVTFAATRRAYVHPAVHWASSRCGRRLPPMGLRLRLRRGYYLNHRADYAGGSQAKAIFRALYRYGMIVADNGSSWFITGAADPGWDDEDVGDLKGVPGKKFVVVRSKAGVRTGC